MTFAGGFAVAKGWLDEASVNEVVGVVVTAVGALWGVVEKAKRNADAQPDSAP